VIWDKCVHGMGDLKKSFGPQHENIIFATKKDFALPYKRPTSVIRIQRVDPQKLRHPNEKPIKLYEYLVNHLSLRGGGNL